jgi:hypothetical protein
MGTTELTVRLVLEKGESAVFRELAELVRTAITRES